MKLFKTALLTSAIAFAGVASATEQFEMTGSPSGLSDQCAFTDVTDGTITHDSSSNTWSTSEQGEVVSRVRNVASISVTAGDTLYDSESDEYESTITYAGSTVSTSANSKFTASASIDADGVDIVNGAGGSMAAGVVTLGISNAITPPSDFVALNSLDYNTVNTVTCTL